jgi:hypothetical protein
MSHAIRDKTLGRGRQFDRLSRAGDSAAHCKEARDAGQGRYRPTRRAVVLHTSSSLLMPVLKIERGRDLAAKVIGHLGSVLFEERGRGRVAVDEAHFVPQHIGELWQARDARTT